MDEGTMPETGDGPVKWRRSAEAGLLRASDEGREVTLMGWVSRVRDHGGVAFMDLRDRSGKVQIVLAGAVGREAQELGVESVVAVSGRVRRRPDGGVNPALPTGEVEVEARELRLLNAALTPPLYIGESTPGPEDGDGETGEVTRLRYRYLDLRRPAMQRNLALRHRMVKAVRDYLDRAGFWEIETPYLTRSTPEGARDYLVPARNVKGAFYALPQSPQLFKQLLMVSGVERYFQVARCFRDEDLRADRQPEFSQIDIEMSFVSPEDIQALSEGLMAHVWNEVLGVSLKRPFPRLSYDEAMALYGTDKPDPRPGMPISDVTGAVSGSEFRVFGEASARGDVVRGFVVRGGAARFSRKDLDGLTAEVRQAGAAGLVWAAFEEGGLRSPAAKLLKAGEVTALKEGLDAGEGDLALLVAASPAVAARVLGALRLKVARDLRLTGGDDPAFLWVDRFPLLEESDAPGRLVAKHHPFTAPVPGDLDLLRTAPLSVRAVAYDLVINGWELGGGSMRNHQRRLQEQVFEAMGVAPQEYREKFGFLLDALDYGAPPHGGIALGVDRLAAVLAGEDSIREVMAFPKTTRATCLLTGAPGPVEAEQLAELGLIPPSGKGPSPAGGNTEGHG